jgi:hypothetical protein
VVAVTNSVEHASEPARSSRPSLDELARGRGVGPVTSVADMAEDGVFASDDELDDFQAHVRAARLADLG